MEDPTEKGSETPTGLTTPSSSPSDETPPLTATVSEPTTPEPSPLDMVKERLASLSTTLKFVVDEKETKRLDIEERFQTIQKQLKDEWEQVEKSYDIRITLLQQELLKGQGVFEYLSNQEKP